MHEMASRWLSRMWTDIHCYRSKSTWFWFSENAIGLHCAYEQIYVYCYFLTRAILLTIHLPLSSYILFKYIVLKYAQVPIPAWACLRLTIHFNPPNNPIIIRKSTFLCTPSSLSIISQFRYYLLFVSMALVSDIQVLLKSYQPPWWNRRCFMPFSGIHLTFEMYFFLHLVAIIIALLPLQQYLLRMNSCFT